MTESARYLKLVEWSDEDGCYVGFAPGILPESMGIRGEDEVSVYRQLCKAVEAHIQRTRREGAPLPEATAGKDYSGRFVLRVDPDIHRKLAIRALCAGESLNTHCARILADAVGGGWQGLEIVRRADAILKPGRAPRR